MVLPRVGLCVLLLLASFLGRVSSNNVRSLAAGIHGLESARDAAYKKHESLIVGVNALGVSEFIWLSSKFSCAQFRAVHDVTNLFVAPWFIVWWYSSEFPAYYWSVEALRIDLESVCPTNASPGGLPVKPLYIPRNQLQPLVYNRTHNSTQIFPYVAAYNYMY